jgi:hypothetical protein
MHRFGWIFFVKIIGLFLCILFGALSSQQLGRLHFVTIVMYVFAAGYVTVAFIIGHSNSNIDKHYKPSIRLFIITLLGLIVIATLIIVAIIVNGVVGYVLWIITALFAIIYPVVLRLCEKRSVVSG